MISIITTSEMQKKIGEITRNIDKISYIVTNNGKGKVVLLPYFDGCNRFIEEYMEDYEMYQNREKLQKKYQKAFDSGPSDLVI